MKKLIFASAPFVLDDIVGSCSASVKTYIFYNEEEYRTFLKHFTEMHRSLGYAIRYKEETFQVSLGDVVVYRHEEDNRVYVTVIEFGT